MISSQCCGLTAVPLSIGCDRCFQSPLAAFQWQLCRPRQQDSSHNSRFCCFPGSTLSTGHGWVSTLVELHLVGNVFPTAKSWLVFLLYLHVLIYLCSTANPKNAKNNYFLVYIGFASSKANIVVTFSYLQVTDLQSSVFLNLPHHCLDRTKYLFIRVKKNVLAASERTALLWFAHNITIWR